MKLTITKEDLAKALNLVSRVISPRPNLPVLNNVLIKANKTGLELAATNLETSIRVRVAAKTTQEGETTVPARVFGEFINTVKEEKVDLNLEKENLQITTLQTTASLATINPKEFPALPEIKESQTEALVKEDFVQALSQVLFSASVDEARPILTGVLLRGEKEGLMFVATDGYRLSKKQTKIKVGFKELIIPARSLAEVSKLIAETSAEEVRFGFMEENNQIVFTAKDFELSTRVLDGSFPPFEKIIPEKFSLETKIDREKFSEAVKQTAVLAKDLGSVVQLEIKPAKGFSISAKTAQLGQALTQLEAQVSGEEIKTAFNSRFLLEGLAAFKEKNLNFDFSGSTDPAALYDKEDPSFTYIVMPVRIQN